MKLCIRTQFFPKYVIIHRREYENSKFANEKE